MEILVDGSRANSDVWLESLTAAPAHLPHLSPEEQRVAASLAVSNEEYARSKYAIEKTRAYLQARAARFGEIVEGLLRTDEPAATVSRVWLNTYGGQYRIGVKKASHTFTVGIPEKTVDALLDGGSAAAQSRVKALLSSHLVTLPVALAS